MTAASLLALCVSRGLRLAPSGAGVHVAGPLTVRDEMREEIREHKAELVSLLRDGRMAETQALYGQAFGRLGAVYGDSLIGNLWPTIAAQHPAMAGTIDTAEQAADAAAIAFHSGNAPDSSAFLAALAEWENRWAAAIAAVTDTRLACSDRGRSDATILVTTATGKFCRACLRPESLNVPPKGRRHHA